MTTPDFLLDLIKDVCVKLGGKPGAHRWEIITAIFGWGAVFSLPAWLVAAWLGLSEIASYAFGVFAFAFGVAFKRDLIRLLRTGRMTI